MSNLSSAERTDSFFIPCVTLIGPGCARETGARAKSLGAKKALIVTDAGLHKMGGRDRRGPYPRSGASGRDLFRRAAQSDRRQRSRRR